MKIVADENIPLVEQYFGASGEIVLKPGRLISRDDLFDADILLVRSVTKVDKLLLHDTPVKFVGSTTAGADHLDTEWLDQVKIDWSVAPGCNAGAVADYVESVIVSLKKQGYLSGKKLRAAVIGVGYVGRLVVEKLKQANFDVIQCDPIRAENEKHFPHTSVAELSNLDFISVHTPLTHHGKFPTFHLVEKNFLERQKKGCILLNAGRGDVVSFADLKAYGKHLYWCFDVWEYEPIIDPEVLRTALIATPHIAGYSKEAKLRGIEMIYHAAVAKNIIVPIPVIPVIHHETSSNFDPIKTTQQMKKSLLEGSETFDNLRKNFSER